METFLKLAEKFEIQVYDEDRCPLNLSKDHVCFTGTPQKHPHDSQKLILITNPFSTHTTYYEFRFGDISHVEKLPSITNPEGETLSIGRIWVKKRSIGVHCIPFRVDDTSKQ